MGLYWYHGEAKQLCFRTKKNAHPFKCSSLFLSFRAKQKNKKDKNKIK